MSHGSGFYLLPHVAHAALNVVPESGGFDALCLDHIARFKRPKAYLYVDTLPKNSTGKVLKTELRKLL